MLPETWLQVSVVLAAVVPGFVYQISVRKVQGPSADEAEALVRVLRAIASSAVFATLYGVAFGPMVVDYVNHPARASDDVRWIALLVLGLVLLIPWLTARIMYYVTTIVLVRTIYDQTTREYVLRRTAQGRTRREIVRCLKRYVARQLYRTLNTPTAMA